MPINKYNKILDPRTDSPADKYDGANTKTGSDENYLDDVDERNTAFLYDLTQEEIMDSIYIGAGPHEKVRSSIKVSEVIPARTATGATETFFTSNTLVYYDPAWSQANVYIQAEPVEFAVPATTISMPYQMKYTVTKTSTAETLGEVTSTPNGQARVDITSRFNYGAGEYSVSVSLVTNTSVYMDTPLYIVGAAPQGSPWCGVPNIGSDGTISYDLTFQTPDIAGVEDWEVELAEL